MLLNINLDIDIKIREARKQGDKLTIINVVELMRNRSEQY